MNKCNILIGPEDFNDKDLPALLVLGEYLTTMEGVFWKQIRGQGLAYSCNLLPNVDSGIVVFYVYRAPDAFKAFDRAKDIINDLVSGKLTFDPKDVEGAKSGVIFSVISDEETMFDAAKESFLNIVIKKTGENASKKMLSQVKAVTIQDLNHVLHKYVKHLFDPKKSNSVVVSAPSKFQEIASSFQKAGYDLVALDSIDSLPAHI